MKTLIIILWLVLLALNVADIITTKIALMRGASEANPLLRALMRVLGRDGGLLLSKAVVLGVTTWVVFVPIAGTPQAVALLLVMNAVYAFVVWRNQRVIEVSKGK